MSGPHTTSKATSNVLTTFATAWEPKASHTYARATSRSTFRWRGKNGLEDLKKAQVYLNWLVETVEKTERDGTQLELPL